MINKIKSMLKDFTRYWNNPKEGNYVSNKEYTALVLGASGNNSVANVLGYIAFGYGCLLLGSIYELRMQDFVVIGVLAIPFTYIFNPIHMIIADNLGDVPPRSMVIVNAVAIPFGLIGIALYFVPQRFFEHILPGMPQIIATMCLTSSLNIYYKIFVYKKMSKKFGKYRPWIIVGILPSIICIFLIAYLPFKSMPYYNRIWTIHLLFSVYGMFSGYVGQLVNINNVISPNTEERANLMSRGAFFYSALPSLVQMVFPSLAMLTGGLNNIMTYRITLPIFVVVLSGLCLFLVFGVKDKVIMEKNHKTNIGLFKGFKEVLKNKYQWIVNLSALFGCFAVGGVVLNNVLFIYTLRQDFWFGIYAGVVGTAFIPGLLMAPFLIKRIGKKNLILASKILAMIFAFGNLWTILIGNPYLFIAVNFISTLLSTPCSVAAQAMGADIWDYQQYISGERLDGCVGIFGMLMTPLTILGGLVVPLIYRNLGFTSDWDILYIPVYMERIVKSTFWIGIVAAATTAIPYFFYNLTEKKHAQIIEELKRRVIEKESIIDESSQTL